MLVAGLAFAIDTAGRGHFCLELPLDQDLNKILAGVQANSDWMDLLRREPCIVSICSDSGKKGLTSLRLGHLISWLCANRIKLKSLWATGHQLKTLDAMKILFVNKIFCDDIHLHVSDGQLDPDNVLGFLNWLARNGLQFGMVRLTGNPGVAARVAPHAKELSMMNISDSHRLTPYVHQFVHIDANLTLRCGTEYQQANLSLGAFIKKSCDPPQQPGRFQVALTDLIKKGKQSQALRKQARKPVPVMVISDDHSDKDSSDGSTRTPSNDGSAQTPLSGKSLLSWAARLTR